MDHSIVHSHSRSRRSITQGEAKFIHDRLSIEENEAFQGWVKVSSLHSTKYKDRLLVVGKYRIFFVSRGPLGGKSIDKSFHLYKISELTMNAGSLIIRYGDKGVCIQSNDLPVIVRDIRIAYRRISHGFEKYAMRVNIPSSMLLELPEETPGICGSIIETYLAQCDFLETQASEAFIRYIHQLYSLSSVSIDLSQCPGIEPKSSMSLDLNSVANTLSMNSYFRTLILCNVTLKKHSGIENSLRYNKCLTTLKLSNLSGVDWNELGLVLISNPDHVLQNIDFSKNDIGLKGLTSIASGLEVFPNSLISLNLAHCQIHPKGIDILFKALEHNFGSSLGIQCLNLSNNKFEEEGSIAFVSWLSKVREFSHLKSLLLSHTGLFFTSVGPWVKNLPYLEELDVSENKIDQEGGHYLRVLVDSSRTLQKLNISNCKLPHESIEEICRGILSNSLISNTHLSVASNELKNFDSVMLVLKENQALKTLDVSDTNLRATGIKALLSALSTCTTIEELRIGANIHGFKEGEKVAADIGEYLKFAPQLKILSLHGKKGSRFRHTLKEFFPYLAEITGLEELDLTYNKLEDSTILALVKGLERNKSLKKLHLDHNSIGINGYLMLKSCLEYHNQTLQEIPFPHIDLKKAQKKLEIQKYQQFLELIVEIQFYLKSRQLPHRQNDEALLSISPLVPLPEHLQTFHDEQHEKKMQERNRRLTHFEPESPATRRSRYYNSLPPETFPPAPSPATAKPSPEQALPETVVCIHPFAGEEPNTLPMKEGDILTVLDKSNSDWYVGELNNQTGYFPSSYVTPNNYYIRALCDYEANDVDEISFKQGDIITVVTKFQNSDWWLGNSYTLTINL